MTSKHPKSCQVIYDDISDLWAIQNPAPFPDWLNKHFYLASESSGTSGRWITRANQRGMCHAMGRTSIQTYIEQKPAQCGGSKRITGYYGYRIAEQQRNIGVYQPTASDASDFSVTQVGSMLRHCARVREAMLVPDPDQKHKFNTDSRKVAKGATAYILSAKAATNFRRITLDDVVVDDWDGMDRIVRGAGNKAEGTVRALSFGRTKASQQPKQILITTPTLVGESLVHEAVEACQNVFHREIPCPHCGEYQELVFNLSTEEGFRLNDSSFGLIYDELGTDEASAKTARYQCRGCGDCFDWEDMQDQDELGRWRSDRLEQIESPGNPYDGYYFEIDDTEQRIVDDPIEVAYTHSALMSYDETWGKTISVYLQALRAMEIGDDSAMISFYNEYLGKAYQPPNNVEINAGDLLHRLEHYDAECPWNVQCITLQVDVQQTYFDFEFIGTGALMESWSLMTGKLHGNTNDRNDHVWQELTELTKRTFEKANGDRLAVKASFIDGRYRPDEVFYWCSQVPSRRMPVQGQPSVHHPLLNLFEPETKPSGRKCWLAKMGPVKASDRVYTMLAFDEPGAGYMHFPLRDGYFEEVIDEETGEVVRKSDYFQQLTADEKHLVRRNGQLVEAYIKPDGKKNEKHDLRKIWCVGMEALFRQSGYKPNDEHPAPYVPDAVVTSAPKKPPSGNPMSGIVDGF